jgi:aspartate dehydrogenase
MRIGILGGGVIARLILEQSHAGALGDARVVGVLGRSASSRGVALGREFGVPFTTDLGSLLTNTPDVVVEAASHDAVREHGASVLEAGVSLIVLSAGALCDDALRQHLETLASRHRAMLYVPAGGIGGLDALKAACAAGVDEVVITIAKPPPAWKGIAFVERLRIDLDALGEAALLFDGPARDGVPHFPANVNIAAVLSMAGIGFDRTRMKVVADPALAHNTHTIRVRGVTGSFSVQLESVPSPDNPKTALLACYSAIAALQAMRSSIRYGT